MVGSGAGPRRGLLLAGSYVLSMALVYAGLGVVAALLGGNLQAWLQQPWLLGSFAALFVFLALPMFGFFELQLPAALRDRLDGLSRGRKGGSLAGAAALGALSGLLVGPCMTAPLAGALLYIAQTGNALHGGLVLFSLGLGIGMPLLLLVTVGSRFLPKPGPWMNLVKGVFGFLSSAPPGYSCVRCSARRCGSALAARCCWSGLRRAAHGARPGTARGAVRRGGLHLRSLGRGDAAGRCGRGRRPLASATGVCGGEPGRYADGQRA